MSTLKDGSSNSSDRFLVACCAAHSQDIKCVRAIPKFSDQQDGTYNILTGSRDNTVKLWSVNGAIISSVKTYKHHTHYVNSIEYILPNSVHPKGLIISGGNDCLIHVYHPDTTEPMFVLIGHKNNVCSLQWLGDALLSTSWDSTAILWRNWQRDKVLVGHSAVVWTGTRLENGVILTGSGDNSIRMWNPTGECTKALHEHGGAVRQIIRHPNGGFVSCGNDGNIILWTSKGEMLSKCGTGTFLYSMVWVSESELVAGGEDHVIQVWKDGQCADNLGCAAESIWSLDCMNGNIVVGASDGKLRIFGREGSPIAESTSGISATRPARADFVFSIDVEDNKPLLELLFNRGEDPWQVSREFVQKHRLSESYVQRIAQFIIQNVPQSDYHVFSTFNRTGILNKFLEFNNVDGGLEDSDISDLRNLVQNQQSVDQIGNILTRVMIWPIEHLFPAYEVARLATLDPRLCVQLRDPVLLTTITEQGDKYGRMSMIERAKLSKCLVRFLTNLFCSESGRDVLVHNMDAVLAVMKQIRDDCKDLSPMFYENLEKFARLNPVVEQKKK